MDNHAFNAISTVDGRYWDKVKELSEPFSEKGLMRRRLVLEVEFFILLLTEGPERTRHDLSLVFKQSLRDLYMNFSDEDMARIKEIEKTSEHDVKAVENFLKEKISVFGHPELKEFVHMGLTSEDVNNFGYALQSRDGFSIIMKKIDENINWLEKFSIAEADTVMLAHTHGQPATGTTLGKETRVFVERMKDQRVEMVRLTWPVKLTGATGNGSTLCLIDPNFDWDGFISVLIQRVYHHSPTIEHMGAADTLLEFKKCMYNTQIESHDAYARICNATKVMNTIFLDLEKDIWTYISFGYFNLKFTKGSTGSTAMPQKVNPIDFENAEGNLGKANALFEHLAATLPISRMQRHLSDSTLMRGMGEPHALSLIAYKATLKGLEKLLPDRNKMKEDLNTNPGTLSEALQLILRLENYPNPYDKVKELTRGDKKITLEAIREFISGLEISEISKRQLLDLTPETYIGFAPSLARGEGFGKKS